MTRSARTALITGASSGLGTCMAHGFAEAGFDVVLCGRRTLRLHAISRNVSDRTRRRCFVVSGDVRTRESLTALAQSMNEHDVDTVINNAAVNPELALGSMASDAVEMADIVSTNTSAAIRVCQAAFEWMSSRGGGTIVNLNSAAGWRGSDQEPVYAASKFGLRGFSESVKERWLSDGVRVVDVYAGAISTGMSASRPDVARLIDPDELARFIVQLCRFRTFFIRDVSVQRMPASLRTAGRTVFANGVFDLLHSGHIALLRFARTLGDNLVVGVNSDRSVKELKDPSRPIQDQSVRRAALERLGFIDEVLIFDDLTTAAVVRRIMPDVIVKGDEYTAEVVRSVDNVPRSIEILTFPVVCTADGSKVSTTSIVEISNKIT